MSKAGKRLLRGAYQALAYAEGRAEPGAFRVRHPDNSNAETSESIIDRDDARIAADSDASRADLPDKNKALTAIEQQKVESNVPAAGS